MLLKRMREDLPLLPRALANAVLDRPGAVIAVAALLTAALAWFALGHFRVSTDMTEMISPSLPFRQVKARYDAAFPDQAQSLVAVVDSPSQEVSRAFLRRLAQRLRANEAYAGVFAPAALDFFAVNGLLYRKPDDLRKLSDDLAQAQAMLGLVSQELSLPNLFDAMRTFYGKVDAFPRGAERLDALLGRLAEVFSASAQGRLAYLSWQEVMSGKAEPARQFAVVSPRLDYSRSRPARAAMAALRADVAAVQAEMPGVSVRLTGNVALREADFASVGQGTELSMALSLAAVFGLVLFCLASWRLAAVGMTVLAVGIAWTVGFALLAFGRLNIISVSFIVLYVGMGIDYSIQFCLGYRANLLAGQDRRTALATAMDQMSNALFLCASTTFVSFLAFVPTAYIGASELGIISGVGMLLYFVLNVTLLPAILRVLPYAPGPLPLASLGGGLMGLPARRPGAVLWVAGALAAASLVALPRMTFDANPLNLSDPRAEAVATAKDLLAGSAMTPWTLSLLAADAREAQAQAERLKALPLVDKVVTVADFVPKDQQAKREIIDELALFLPTLPEKVEVRAMDPAREAEALAAFAAATQDYARRTGSAAAQALALAVRDVALGPQGATVVELKAGAAEGGEAALALVRRGALQPLALLLGELRDLTGARPFGPADLPAELTGAYVARDGRQRVQVFPKENIGDTKRLEAFVDAVTAVEPEVSGPPASIVGSARAISRAFLQAVVASVLLTLGFMYLLRPHLLENLLMMGPLLLAMLLAMALAAGLGMPFNFANVIVIPLLLCLGSDYSILLLYRYRQTCGNMPRLLEAGTARGVIFSALTTLASCASMIFHSHRGLSSMGVLLTATCLLMLVCSLVVLPAALARVGGRLLNRACAPGGEGRP